MNDAMIDLGLRCAQGSLREDLKFVSAGRGDQRAGGPLHPAGFRFRAAGGGGVV